MTEEEAAVLKAEVVALQAVLMAVFRRLLNDRPELGGTFCAAFDQAETILAGVAVKMGLEAPREVTVGALTVLEQIRAGVIRDESICRE